MIAALALSTVMFATPDAAAHSALKLAAECSENVRECGGVIWRDNIVGDYIYSAPVPGKSFGVDLSQFWSRQPPKDFTLVADYHVHICNRHNKLFSTYFSPADGYVNKGFHTVGYMLSLCDHMIRRFDPQEKPYEVMVVHFHSGNELELPIGHINGYLP